MPRVSETVDDRTPIAASRIDVAARIGWMMRTHRSVAGLSLREMSAALKGQGAPLSAATLSRIESEGQRSPAALDGYERALGLSDGALRAPVDLMCRTFPYAPEVVARPAPPSLERFSLAFEAIDVASPTGGAWLELAGSTPARASACPGP
ncbi:helix-turn-helix domain-containing protein [Nocardioides ungokensis]|uniref:helix-turn-helix domain-containing protein n=1 Tax=Nocardioides ungokensis TaxID=1643322 RepID=UPI0015DDCC68|nr:helix-turn-helix domain-containing protein [Nocardioides ungokensis]